jgi:hypothetical protein
MFPKVYFSLFAALILFTCCMGRSEAFDAADYQGLAEATSSATIPPGTKITAGNWQQYKQFIPVSLQWLYSGKYPWKVPVGDDFSIVIGPTISIPVTHQFAIDTEKYSNQVSLDPMPNGGFDIKGYVAGLPFPHPTGPNVGIEILYNFYFHYQPHVLKNYYRSLTIDRYQNESATEVVEVFNRLMHTSDVNTPIDNPLAGGYFQAGIDEVTVPEQSKYTSALTLFPDDVKRLEEFYVFLPSLRRSLRLSSAARCSPILGSDYLNDDNRDGFNGIPTQFKVVLLGEKKIISLVHEDLVTRQQRNSFTTNGLPGWSKPVTGKWELRDAYLLDIRALGSAAATYCYGSRVLYVDKESSTPLFVDLYDNSLKPWKVTVNRYGPIPINDGLGGIAISPGDSNPTIYDIQNVHAGLVFQKQVADANSAVPVQFRDVQRYATPGGLAEVMR